MKRSPLPRFVAPALGLVAALALTLGLLTVSPGTASADSGDYVDPHRLDADNDGIGCEVFG